MRYGSLYSGQLSCSGRNTSAPLLVIFGNLLGSGALLTCALLTPCYGEDWAPDPAKLPPGLPGGAARQGSVQPALLSNKSLSNPRPQNIQTLRSCRSFPKCRYCWEMEEWGVCVEREMNPALLTLICPTTVATVHELPEGNGC